MRRLDALLLPDFDLENMPGSNAVDFQPEYTTCQNAYADSPVGRIFFNFPL